jgi:hypothetical protein
MRHAMYQMLLNGDSRAERGCRYAQHIELTENEMTQSGYKASNSPLQRFDSAVLREDRHLFNVLTHFIERLSELYLTVQQISK